MKPSIRVLTTLLCLLALGCTFPLAATGQESNGDRLRVELERTDERIQLAQSLALGTDNAQVQQEVAAAVVLQGQAHNAYNQGLAASGQLQVQLFHQSLGLTLKARSRADRAISLIRGLPDPERVLAQVERTREMLDRARDRIEECGNDRARALLRVAFEMQARAELAVKDSRYLAALQLTLSARERALRALRLCNMEENLREAAERALRRTDEVLARARDLVADNGHDQAREVLQRAERIQTEAHAQFRSEHFEASLRLTHSARTLAYRAIRLAGGNP
jgi:hypothetical protein